MRINLFKIYMLLLIDYYKPHGYELMKRIRSMSNDLIKAGPGTIYPLLFLLKRQKLIREVVEGRKKRYVLTEKGLEVLRENLPKLSRMIDELRLIIDEELRRLGLPSSRDEREDRDRLSDNL